MSIYLQLERGIVAFHFTLPVLSVKFEVGEIASPATVELHNKMDSITVRPQCIHGHQHILHNIRSYSCVHASMRACRYASIRACARARASVCVNVCMPCI